MVEMTQIVYILERAGKFVSVHRSLESSKAVYPGTWEGVYNGPIRTPDEWNLGDARIFWRGLQD